MSDLITMPNIGKEMASKLSGVEIDTAEKLTAIGAKEAFFRLKAKYPQVCLVHLYTLQAAIEGVAFDALSAQTKADLKAFSDSLKQGKCD
ncbi:MAG: TfoX/Sxy family protein [Clostridiales bacterium]|nr:TfoX/Sxy family protein [Clostridiales bacterium]